MFSKTLVVLAAVAAVSVNALSKEECSKALTSEIAKLTKDVLPFVSPCSSDSGFSMVPPSGLPTEAQYVKMCASSNCKSLLKAVNEAGLLDCDLDFSVILPGSVPLNVYQLGKGFDDKCKAIGGGGSTPTTAPTTAPPTGSNPTSAPPTGTTPGVTPSPTTPKPAC